MRKNNGGQAFPGYFCDEDGEDLYHHGMSLRDYFAGQALSAALSDYDMMRQYEKVCSESKIPMGRGIAKMCYEYADAMIKERDK